MRQYTPRIAELSTIRRSHQQASSSPPATAYPDIAAMTGFLNNILVGLFHWLCSRKEFTPSVLRQSCHHPIFPLKRRLSHQDRATLSSLEINDIQKLVTCSRAKCSAVTGKDRDWELLSEACEKVLTSGSASNSTNASYSLCAVSLSTAFRFSGRLMEMMKIGLWD